MAMASIIPIMATTTISSTRVKPPTLVSFLNMNTYSHAGHRKHSCAFRKRSEMSYRKILPVNPGKLNLGSPG